MPECVLRQVREETGGVRKMQVQAQRMVRGVPGGPWGCLEGTSPMGGGRQGCQREGGWVQGGCQSVTGFDGTAGTARVEQQGRVPLRQTQSSNSGAAQEGGRTGPERPGGWGSLPQLSYRAAEPRIR